MSARRRQVLLVAKSVMGMLKLAEFLGNSGCDCQIVTSFHDARQRVAANSYDLILSETTLPDANGYRLISLDLGPRASLYFALPVYDSCLWLPAIAHGRHCFGEAALRPSEFTRTLREVLQDKTPVEPDPAAPQGSNLLGLGMWSSQASGQSSHHELVTSVVCGGGRADRYVSPKQSAHEKL